MSDSLPAAAGLRMAAAPVACGVVLSSPPSHLEGGLPLARRAGLTLEDG